MLENCDIFGNVLAGVKVKQGGKLLIKGGSIHDGGGSGVLICEGGEGTVEEDCNIFGNNFAGVEIRQSANAKVRHCKIRDGNWIGILICENNRRVEVEDCEISGSAYVGVEVKKQPGDVIQGKRGGDAKTESGEVEVKKQPDDVIQEVSSTSSMRMDMVEIGVVIQRLIGAFYSLTRIAAPKRQPNVVIQRCTIKKNPHGAILVGEKSQIIVRGCDFAENGPSEWYIEVGSQVQRD